VQLTAAGIVHPLVNSWVRIVAFSGGPVWCGSTLQIFRPARFRPLHGTANDYFKPAGCQHRGDNVTGAEGLLCFGIAASASFEMILVTPLSLIARTT